MCLFLQILVNKLIKCRCQELSKSFLFSRVNLLVVSDGCGLIRVCPWQPAPSPCRRGRTFAEIGVLIPEPSLPSPIPGTQPILCSILLPMFDSGIGSQNSPTKPVKSNIILQKPNNIDK